MIQWDEQPDEMHFVPVYELANYARAFRRLWVISVGIMWLAQQGLWYTAATLVLPAFTEAVRVHWLLGRAINQRYVFRRHRGESDVSGPQIHDEVPVQGMPLESDD